MEKCYTEEWGERKMSGGRGGKEVRNREGMTERTEAEEDSEERKDGKGKGHEGESHVAGKGGTEAEEGEGWLMKMEIKCERVRRALFEGKETRSSKKKKT